MYDGFDKDLKKRMEFLTMFKYAVLMIALMIVVKGSDASEMLGDELLALEYSIATIILFGLYLFIQLIIMNDMDTQRERDIEKLQQ